MGPDGDLSTLKIHAGWEGIKEKGREGKGCKAWVLFERLSQSRQKIGQHGNDYCRVHRCVRSVV